MTEKFYASGVGDRLIDPALLPTIVHKFLDEEQRFLTRLADQFDVLVEVGSMHGLHLDWAVTHDKSYTGLDVVERYVAQGKHIVTERGLTGDRYQFVCIGAEWLPTVALPPGRAVAFFPFNSLGNMDALAALDALSASGLRFLISTYGTDPNATKYRWKYYNACAYEGLTVLEDQRGVRFTAVDGLDTVAYHPEYLMARMAERGLLGVRLSFAEFGSLFLSRSLMAALRL